MPNLLDSINNPDDLKKVRQEELPKLAEEIRHRIINTISSSGGHLASSLGAVELAIAVHYCFNTPDDIVIWDVGHQAYAHKLLTGRRDAFNTLRQPGGLSGFPNKYESPYDVFTTGHGSTSISTALGMAAARDIEKKSFKIAAVIGDASLGGGMAFEALNHAGHLRKKMIVVLNDNEMSISKSVGALSKYLNSIITNPKFNKIRKDMEGLLAKVPRFGFSVIRSARRLEEAVKNLLVPGIIFEELGFRYFGPIDGNNISMLVKMFRNTMDMDEPVLLHVITKKGKGYGPAENLPEKFHGIGSFNIATGEKSCKGKEDVNKSEIGFTKVFGDKIIELAEKDKRVIGITAAMCEGTGLDIFAKMFPDRFFDVGMAEEHAVGFAAGLARAGLKPVVAIYSTFLQRSYDQIIHDVCLQNLNVVFLLDRAGLVGEDGPTHHGVFDISYLRNLPNMIFMAPRDENELKAMAGFAILYEGGPVAIRYPRGQSYSFKGSNISTTQNIELGKPEILKSGRDVTVLSLGYMTNVALEAGELLAKKGIDCEIINARFIKPVDIDQIYKSVLKTRILVTVEEGVLNGGFGSYIVELLIDKKPKDIIIKNIGLPDRFIEHGNRGALLDKYGLSSDKIAQTIEKLFNAKNRD